MPSKVHVNIYSSCRIFDSYIEKIDKLYLQIQEIQDSGWRGSPYSSEKVRKEKEKDKSSGCNFKVMKFAFWDNTKF